VAEVETAIMKRILSEVLRRKDGVERRNGRAGALRIEFIERSRNQSLGIEWVFAVDRAKRSTCNGAMEGGWRASRVENAGTGRWRESSRQVPDRLETEIW
jgi:hypothetical protein